MKVFSERTRYHCKVLNIANTNLNFSIGINRRRHGFSYGGAKPKNSGPFSAKIFFRKRRPIRLSVNGVKGRSKWKRQYLYDTKCKLNFYR